jgi:hypothetical protein
MRTTGEGGVTAGIAGRLNGLRGAMPNQIRGMWKGEPADCRPHMAWFGTLPSLAGTQKIFLFLY